MKKTFLTANGLAVSLLLSVVCWSCAKGRGEVEQPLYSAEDTATVLQLTEEYLDHVHDGEYDAAIAMLHDIQKYKVCDLSEEAENQIREQQQAFPVLGYQLSDMVFNDNGCVSVTYDIEFFEKEPGSSIPNTIQLTFVPQRVGDKWYLELSERATSRRTGRSK